MMLLLLSSLVGCGPDVSITRTRVDQDSDGYTEEVDCNDGRADINPEAEEVCDGVDNNCDGVVDDAGGDVVYYSDADGDGFGGEDSAAVGCTAPSGTVTEAGDCDDAAPEVSPAASEVCDGLDNDCDAAVDEDASDEGVFYADEDGDGYGDPALTSTGCAAPSGYVADDTDCDDADSSVHPDAEEADCTDPVDYNCDGSSGYADADADGWPACTDCDDSTAARNPSLPEVCDEADLDEDCDGGADDADDAPTGTTTWTRDADGDTYGEDGGLTVELCDAPAGYAANAGDCDDLDSTVNPAATESCDDADTDEDCDGTADDDDTSVDPATWTTWHRDNDGDAYGDAARSVSLCDAPGGYVADDTDCDDSQATVNPGATEVCDSTDTDEDCDGFSDDDDASATATSTWYRDSDGDTYGDDTRTSQRCEAPSGYVASTGDCDDGASAVNPSAAEVCDSADVDEDCDALADDDDASATGQSTTYRDVDGDSFGDPSSAVSVCDAPTGNVSDATDCDDATASVNPAATEVCDAADIDEDCDGRSDDADSSVSPASWATWYRDADADAYGDAARAVTRCDAPAGYIADAQDCDDAAAGVHPGAVEVCDPADADEDCDGLSDDADGSATGLSPWYRDIDVDGYGDVTNVTLRCDVPAGYAGDGSDCDDVDGTVNPGAPELCDALDVDEDCDATADDDDPDSTGQTSFYADVDVDTYGDPTDGVSACDAPSGYVARATDCDDTDADDHPGGAEVCNADDEDCDGVVDDGVTTTWYIDADADAYGSTTTTVAACAAPSGYVANSADCDDAASGVSPGAVEVCDGADTDEDCDGLVDDADGSATGQGTFYDDADGDGYGDAAGNVPRCDPASGYVTDATDCDDASASVHPDAAEACDGLDNDCDASTPDLCGYAEGAYTEADGTVYGEAASDTFGAAIVTGDFDGDGDDEVAVGADGNTYSGTYEGSVYVYDGVFPTTAYDADTNDIARVYGPGGVYTFATQMWPLDDLDGDGRDELVVFRHSSSTDYVFVYEGEDLSGDVAGSSAMYLTAGFTTLGSAGDFNATSGNNEWVGGNRNATGTGKVYFGTGTSSSYSSMSGESASDNAGCSVDGGEGNDLDGDGYDDVFVGAYGDDDGATDAGAAYVVLGPHTSSTTLASADQKIRGLSASDLFGSLVSAPGDMDGDGTPDLFVGAPYDDDGDTNAGVVFLFDDAETDTTSSQAVAKVLGASASDLLGAYWIEAGDVDDDGYRDVWLGTPNAQSTAGAGYLVYGPLSGTYDLGLDTGYDLRFIGDDSADGCGYSGALGDLDGDGAQDMLLGCRYGDEATYTDRGTVHLFMGG